MTLRIPLSPDQTLQTEFHEIERRLRKLERTLGQTAGSTTVRVIGSGNSTAGVNLQPLLDRITALEQAVAALSVPVTPDDLPELGPVGPEAQAGIAPDPGIAEPPTGVAQHILTEDATWGFPFRGLVQVTSPGDETDPTDSMNVMADLGVNGNLTAYDIVARQVMTLEGVTVEGDVYQLTSLQRGLVFAVTQANQTELPYDVVDINAALHTQHLSAADVECFNLHTHGDIEYNDSFYDDLRIEPVARTAGANAPTFEQWADDAGLGDTGTSRGIYLYSFDDALAAAEKEVFFSMQMPHAWKLGTPILMHVHWIGAVSDTTAAPRWGLEYAWKDIGQTFGATETIIYTTGENIDASGTPDPDVTAGKHYISEFGRITPGTSADGLSSILVARLFRNSSDAADTYNAAGAKCGLLYVDAHYETDSPGSSSEYVK